MLIRKYDTIIIGGGVAGLACARELVNHQKNFILITENIGGRIVTSKSGQTNYGAYFVLKTDHNILHYVQKKEKLHPLVVGFHSRQGKAYHLLRMMKYPGETVRLLAIVIEFKRKYETFKKLCPTKSQNEIIQSNRYYLKLYSQTAAGFVEENDLKRIAQEFLSEGMYMCTFQPLNKISAFDFLRLCTALITPAYEFKFLKDTMTEGFRDKIIYDSVSSLRRGKTNIVKTKTGKVISARNVVVATPPHLSQKLLKLQKIKKSVDAFAFHLSGELKEKSGQFELFPTVSKVIFIRKQNDGSYILYSKVNAIEFKKYFHHPKLIAKKEWRPAFHTEGSILWDSDLGNNVYLVGDHNLIGLETAYLTGVYAANKIIAAK